jgi:phage baseplate assembly protein V
MRHNVSSRVCSHAVRYCSRASATKLQTLQVRILAGETKGDVEHFEPYGFTSCPLAGAEGIVAFPGADRSHAVLLVVATAARVSPGSRPGGRDLYARGSEGPAEKRPHHRG